MSASEQDVELAILSMDAYNEGYSPGMSLPNTTPIGGARRSADSTAVLGVDANGVPVDQSATFYAVAYQWQGETIISYRGTQLSTLSSTLGDVLNGCDRWVGLRCGVASTICDAVLYRRDRCACGGGHAAIERGADGSFARRRSRRLCRGLDRRAG